MPNLCPHCDAPMPEGKMRCAKCLRIDLWARPLVAGVVYTVVILGLFLPLVFALTAKDGPRNVWIVVLAVPIIGIWAMVIGHIALNRGSSKMADDESPRDSD